MFNPNAVFLAVGLWLVGVPHWIVGVLLIVGAVTSGLLTKAR